MKKLFLGLILIGCVAGGAFIYLRVIHASPASTEDAPKLTSRPLVKAKLYETVSGTAIVQPPEVVSVTTEVSGRVVKITKDFRDRVKEGEELVQIDDAIPRQKLQQALATRRTAEAAHEAAQADVLRVKSLQDAAKKELKLKESSSLSELALLASKAQVAAAEAAVGAAEAKAETAKRQVEEAGEGIKLAQLALDMTHVYAPVIKRTGNKDRHVREVGEVATGPQSIGEREYVVLDRKVALNQLVGPPGAAHLFTLATSPDRMVLHAQISESDIGKVAPGQDVVFTVSAHSDVRFWGKVVEVRPVPVTVQGAVFYIVVIEAENKPEAKTSLKKMTPEDEAARCLPGMPTASLDIIYKKHTGPDGQGVWLVPETAVGFQLDDHYKEKGASDALNAHKEMPHIWEEVNDHTARPVHIETGASGKLLDRDTIKVIDPKTGNEVTEAVDQDGDMSFKEILRFEPEKVKPTTPDTTQWPKVVINADPPKKSRWSGITSVLRLN